MEKHAKIFSENFQRCEANHFTRFFFAIVLFFIFAVSFRSLRILYISCVLKQKAIWLEGHMNLKAPPVTNMKQRFFHSDLKIMKEWLCFNP